MSTATIAFALIFAASTLHAFAQNAGGLAAAGSSSSGALGCGQGRQHQHPSPAQIAEHVMKKFDANKDGKLEQGELTQALEALRNHHRQSASGGGQGGQHHGLAGSGSPQGTGSGGSGLSGGHHAPPAADKVAAHLIEKFAADKKGLTQAELAKAIAAHHAHHGQHGGGAQQGGAHAGNTGSGITI